MYIYGSKTRFLGQKRLKSSKNDDFLAIFEPKMAQIDLKNGQKSIFEPEKPKFAWDEP